MAAILAKVARRPTRLAAPARFDVEPLEGRTLLSAGWPGTSFSHFVGSSHSPRSAIRSAMARRDSTAQAGATGDVGVRVQKDIVYRADGVKLDLYTPAGPVPAGGWPTVVAFPGGGWRWASKREY